MGAENSDTQAGSGVRDGKCVEGKVGEDVGIGVFVKVGVDVGWEKMEESAGT